MKKTKRAQLILRLFALILSTVPVAACVLLYFPLWKDMGGGALLSGFTLLLLLISAVPLFNYVRTTLKTPAAHTMWFISFLLFFSLSRIADQMCVISLVGFISNLIASFLFKAANAVTDNKSEKRKDEDSV